MNSGRGERRPGWLELRRRRRRRDRGRSRRWRRHNDRLQDVVEDRGQDARPGDQFIDAHRLPAYAVVTQQQHLAIDYGVDLAGPDVEQEGHAVRPGELDVAPLKRGEAAAVRIDV